MGKAIVLNFPKIPRDERNRLSEAINTQLESISNEITNWNGFIDVINTENNKFNFVANCDNDAVRQKMQELLDAYAKTL